MVRQWRGSSSLRAGRRAVRAGRHRASLRGIFEGLRGVGVLLRPRRRGSSRNLSALRALVPARFPDLPAPDLADAADFLLEPRIAGVFDQSGARNVGLEQCLGVYDRLARTADLDRDVVADEVDGQIRSAPDRSMLCSATL